MKPSLLDIKRIRASISPTDLGEGVETKAAAVAVVIREDPDGPHVLLIKRATREGDPWSGHMAFPGGRSEPSDRDLLHTAVRETLEEVGLDLERDAELLGALPDVPSIRRGELTGWAVRTFVFALAPDAPAPGLSDEVAALVWAPLNALYLGEIATTIDYDHLGTKLVLPAHDVGGHIVWGLTHRMLALLFQKVDGTSDEGA